MCGAFPMCVVFVCLGGLLSNICRFGTLLTRLSLYEKLIPSYPQCSLSGSESTVAAKASHQMNVMTNTVTLSSNVVQVRATLTRQP